MPDSRNAGTSASHVFCSACGTKNLAKHSFCSACGTRLVSPHNVPTLPMNVHQMQRASSPQYSEQFWRWFRQRHAALQIIGWLAFWWLLLPVLIWRTGWDTRLKLVLSAPFALCVIGALFGGPRDRRQMEQGLQQSVAVADTQPRGVPEVNALVQESAAPTARNKLSCQLHRRLFHRRLFHRPPRRSYRSLRQAQTATSAAIPAPRAAQ
jgi:hypothetical protein